MMFSKFYEKTDIQDFFDFFLCKATVAYKAKIDLINFLGKNLVLRFLGQKQPEMGPNIESQDIEIF